jgi:DNA-binding CsgD family transcriptional regulator
MVFQCPPDRRADEPEQELESADARIIDPVRSMETLACLDSQVPTRSDEPDAATRLGRPRVSARAEEVVRLRAEGRSWRQAAAVLGISARTARRLMAGRGKTSEQAIEASA